ncbi:hypothetical protein [Dethiothermospora halolimnae]|uniref:hypothetical protein n=1 Tax=Dethiothermospora halolimnae TaxID=3114390 RepID=UPI003CCC3EC4
MKLKIYIEEFLDYQKKEGFLKEASVNNYRSKLEIFHDFLYAHEKVQDSTLDTILNGLDISKVFESIKYYISSRGIKAEYSVRLYTSVLSEFLKFLFSNKKVIVNDNLIKSMGTSYKNFNESFSAQITQYINRLLDEKIIVYGVSEEPISDEEYIKLIEYCDINLHIGDIEDLFLYNKRNDAHIKYVGALMLKFILAFGFKVNILYKLDVKCINLSNNTIKHNGYSVYLPDNLSYQVKEYMEIRERIQTNSDKLFVDYKGNEIRSSDTINTYIQNNILKGNTKKVSKYIIMKMFQEGIPRMVIEEFTGYKNKILNYCQCRVYELKALKKDVYLKSKMISIDVNQSL